MQRRCHPAGHVDAKDFDKSVACNLRATADLIPLEPLLRAGNGTALFLDDPRGGEILRLLYGATKAAQIALARSWQAGERKDRPARPDRHPEPSQHRHPRPLLPR